MSAPVEAPSRTLLLSDWSTALYENGVKVEQRPAVPVARVAAVASMVDNALYVPDGIYLGVAGPAGFPQRLDDIPLFDCQRLR